MNPNDRWEWTGTTSKSPELGRILLEMDIAAMRLGLYVPYDNDPNKDILPQIAAKMLENVKELKRLYGYKF